MVNIRTDALQTDMKLSNCPLSQIHVSVRILTIKISQWARVNFCFCCKIDIKTWSKYMEPTRSAGKRVRTSHDWFWFYFWCDEKVKQLCNRKVRDFAMAFRARKVSGAFEKRSPGLWMATLNEKSKEVCIKARSLPVSLAFKGQVTKHTLYYWWSPIFFAFLKQVTYYLTEVKIFKESIDWEIFARTSLSENRSNGN